MHGLGKTEAQLTGLKGGLISSWRSCLAAGQVLLPESAPLQSCSSLEPSFRTPQLLLKKLLLSR